MKCAIYVRVSTDNQVEKDYNSLETQKESLLAYIQSHKYEGWELYDFYEDGGYSASNLNRPELQRLLADGRKKKFDAVLVYKIDRLTRNQKDFYSLIESFEKHNITFISATQNFDTSSAAGRLMRNIMLDFAQFERDMTSERTKDKMRARSKRGMWNGGLPPLGYDYDKEKKRLFINKKEAEIVKLIFDFYIEEASLRKVTDKINSFGHRSKKHIRKNGEVFGDNEFIMTSIRQILLNPIYTGVIRYEGKDFQGQHEAIIDKNIFDKVQSILSKNKKTHTSSNQNKYDFLLHGLVKCGYCGSVMSSHYALKNGKKYFYYKCTRIMHRNRKACLSKPLSAREFEGVIVKKIREFSRDKNLLKSTIENANQNTRKELEPIKKKQRDLENQTLKLQDEIKRLIKAIRTGDSEIEAVEFELKDLEQRKKNLEKEIQQLRIHIQRESSKLIDLDIVQRTYQGFGQVYDNLSPKEKRHILQLLIKEIVCYPNKIKARLFEVPEIALSDDISSGLYEPTKWLPG